MSDTAIALAILALFVGSVAFLVWSFCLSTLGWAMGTALWANIVMGLTGLVLLMFGNRLVGSVFVAGSVVGLSVVSAAFWVRPVSTASGPDSAGETGQTANPVPESVEGH